LDGDQPCRKAATYTGQHKHGRHANIQDDSELLSGYPIICHGKTDNNLELLCTSMLRVGFEPTIPVF
jgi:hypothetical protein